MAYKFMISFVARRIIKSKIKTTKEIADKTYAKIVGDSNVEKARIL